METYNISEDLNKTFGKPGIRNYIFDFDGTLMDTQAVILATIVRTISDLGLPSRTIEQCKTIIGIRTAEAAAVLYPDWASLGRETDVDAFNATFAAKFRQNYDTLKHEIPITPFPGVMETLTKLHDSGHPMAIATSRRHESVVEYLTKMGIVDWFEMIVGADDVVNGKPDPEPVVKILDSMGWEPDLTLMVGDAPVDILMGNAARCHTCAVTYGNGTRANLAAAHPDMIVDDFSSIEFL